MLTSKVPFRQMKLKSTSPNVKTASPQLKNISNENFKMFNKLRTALRGSAVCREGGFHVHDGVSIL